MLQVCAIAPDTLELLKKLQAMPALADTRLVGGTALALHFGHRLSVDLDCFGNFDPEIITEILASENFNDFTIIADNRIIKHYVINRIKVDLVKYDRYPWLENIVLDGQVRLASLKDIAAMKIAAITNRGSRKDFVDLYFLLGKFPLKEIIDLYQTKYFDTDIWFAIRSLSYFEDAEQEEMPKMLIPATWDEIKTRILAEVRNL